MNVPKVRRLLSTANVALEKMFSYLGVNGLVSCTAVSRTIQRRTAFP